MDISLIFLILAVVAICVLVFLLFAKNHHISQLSSSLFKLKKSFNELDNQAKLIIKTDLALNKAQEESDKRLTGLEALHKTSRLISTSLDEVEIFHRLNESLHASLGFDKILILIYDVQKNIRARVSIGYDSTGSEIILSSLQKDAELLLSLSEGNIFSSIQGPPQ